MSRRAARWVSASASLAILGLALSRLAIAAPCVASTLSAPDASQGPTMADAEDVAALALSSHGCGIEPAMLQAELWKRALVIDVRRRGELDGVHLPDALQWARADLEDLLQSASGHAVLLVGSGLDDTSLLTLCARLAEQRSEPTALLKGGIPAWPEGGRPLLLPEQETPRAVALSRSPSAARKALEPRMRLSPQEFVAQLGNPTARVLVLDSSLPLSDGAAAELTVLDRSADGVTALRRALIQWLGSRLDGHSGPLIVVSRPGQEGVFQQLAKDSEPLPSFWRYLHTGDADLRAGFDGVRPLDTGPLRREGCAWN